MSKNMFFTLVLWAAFFLASPPSCVHIKGQSSGEIKRGMQQSFLFKSADIFYPAGIPDEPDQFPKLDAKQVESISVILQLTLKRVKTLHKRYHERLADIFERPLPSEIIATLVLMNIGKPIAFIDPTGDVNIDVKIIQAFYRTALVSGLQDKSIFGPRFMDNRHTASEAPSEQELIKEFLEVKDRVMATEGRSIFGDLGEALGDKGMEGSWFSMVDLATTSMTVEKHYYGPMQFLFAHEFAHGVLGHLETSRELAPDDCESFRDLEMEADAYALLLLYLDSLEYGQASLAFFGVDFFGTRSLYGFDDFFQYTYDFSGFVRSDGSMQCSHPDPEDRLRNINELYTSMTEAVSKAVWERALEGKKVE